MDIDKRFQQTYRQKIPTDRHTDGQKVPTDNETYIWTRDSNRQRDKHTDKSFQQTERQTDGQMY